MCSYQNKYTARKTGRKYNWLTELCRQTRILHEISPTELNIYLAMFSIYMSMTKERFRYYEPNTIRGYLGRFYRLRENGYKNIIESHRFSERHTLNLVKNF
jgi:hypothetical protein